MGIALIVLGTGVAVFGFLNLYLTQMLAPALSATTSLDFVLRQVSASVSWYIIPGLIVAVLGEVLRCRRARVTR